MDRRRHTRIVAAACKWGHSAVWCQRAGGVGRDWDYSRSRESSSYVDNLLCHTEVWPILSIWFPWHWYHIGDHYWTSNMTWNLPWKLDVLKGVYSIKQTPASNFPRPFSLLLFEMRKDLALFLISSYWKWMCKNGGGRIWEFYLTWTVNWNLQERSQLKDNVLPSSTTRWFFHFVYTFSLHFHIHVLS